MYKLIYVLNPDVAETLRLLGFRYILSKINNEDVLAFEYSNDLYSYVLSNYSESDFVISDTMMF